MTQGIYERERAQVKYWWLSVLVGIASLVVGFLVLVNPIESYFVMAMWLGIVILFTGIFSLVEAFTSHSRYVRRGWLVLASICDIIIGIVLMLNFLLSVAIIPIFSRYLATVLRAIGYPLACSISTNSSSVIG